MSSTLLDQLLESLIHAIRPAIIAAVRDAMSEFVAAPIEKPPEEDLLTISEATALLKCSKASIYNWVRSGKIRSWKIGNRAYYKKADLMKSLRERKFK